MVIYQVDAFTDSPFRGNPAGVCVLEEALSEEMMANLASEMSLSETAFLLKEKDGYRLRWLTPTNEVDLCGHATLSAAHILYERGFLAQGERAIFYTRSGTLYAEKKGDDIVLDFPREDDTPCEPAEGLLEALGANFTYCGKNRLDWLLEVNSIQTLKSLTPDMNRLSVIGSTIVERPELCRGFIVTTKGSGEFDFISRYFAPADGIPEDPVTGSVHCCLAPYWSRKLGKNEFVAYQASKRGGVLKLALSDTRTYISGKAVTVMVCSVLV